MMARVLQLVKICQSAATITRMLPRQDSRQLEAILSTPQVRFSLLAVHVPVQPTRLASTCQAHSLKRRPCSYSKRSIRSTRWNVLRSSHARNFSSNVSTKRWLKISHLWHRMRMKQIQANQARRAEISRRSRQALTRIQTHQTPQVFLSSRD